MKNKILYILSLSLLLGTSLFAKREHKVDHLALASMMIYDGKYKKAHQELEEAIKSKRIDEAKYYTVLGVLFSKENKTKEATAAYKKAIEATKIKEFKAPKTEGKQEYLFSIGSDEKKSTKEQFDPQKKKKEKLEQLYMYLTQEYYKRKEYKNTVVSLEKAGERGKSKAGLYTLRAECYYKLKDYDRAIEALNKGIKKFPNDEKLLKQKFYYYADLGLYQAAVETAKEYMKRFGASAKEYITLAQVLIAANQIDSAIEFLENAKLKYPKEPKIGILLGHMYLKKEMPHATAQLFDESFYYDKRYLKDAVEVNRRAGNITHALYLNTQNIDKREKIKQKIAIYLQAGEYRKIIGLRKALDRYKMLENENLRYVLAYAYYMAGDYKNSEEQLKYITKNELFSKAMVIRKNIEKCTNNTMECL